MKNRKQKSSIVAIGLMVFLSSPAFSQGEFFISIDAGVLSDRNHFVSQTGQAVTAGAVGGHLIGSFGFRKNDVILAVGFGRYRHGLRDFDLERSTGVFSRANSSGSAVENFVIPVTFAKEFQVYRKWHLGLGVGIQGLISREAGDRNKSINYKFDDDPSRPWQENVNADSTVTIYGTDRKFNMAFETSVYAMYKTVGRGPELFMKFAYQGHINPTFETQQTFYAESGTTLGTSTVVNSFTIGVGIRFFFRKGLAAKAE